MPPQNDRLRSETATATLRLESREASLGGWGMHQHSSPMGVGKVQAFSSCPPKIAGFGREEPLDEGFAGRLNGLIPILLHITYIVRTTSQR